VVASSFPIFSPRKEPSPPNRSSFPPPPFPSGHYSSHLPLFLPTCSSPCIFNQGAASSRTSPILPSYFFFFFPQVRTHLRCGPTASTQRCFLFPRSASKFQPLGMLSLVNFPQAFHNGCSVFSRAQSPPSSLPATIVAPLSCPLPTPPTPEAFFGPPFLAQTKRARSPHEPPRHSSPLNPRGNSLQLPPCPSPPPSPPRRALFPLSTL